jgi:hypothetical protein
MSPLPLVKLAGIVAVAGTLAGCAASPPGALGFGSDGSLHPDATAGLANYTGQGEDGQGWAGDNDGEGGPSEIGPARDDLTPH